jgi:hypothetical protein
MPWTSVDAASHTRWACYPLSSRILPMSTFERSKVLLHTFLTQGSSLSNTELPLERWIEGKSRCFADCPDTVWVYILPSWRQVAWASQQQKSTAKPSTEDVYLGYSEAGSEAICLQRPIRDLGVQSHESTPGSLHRQLSAIAMTETTMVIQSYAISRYIGIWYVKNPGKKICLRHTPGSTLVADGLTKALPNRHAENSSMG